MQIVRRAVLEREIFRQRGVQQIEVQQGRILQHAERPLEGIRHERNPFVLEHSGPKLGVPRGSDLCLQQLFRANNISVLNGLLKEFR